MNNRNGRNAPFTRRSFLKGAALAAAGAAMGPNIVPGRALGLAGAAPASERITIGVIGTGVMCMRTHLPNLLNMADTQVVAVCDVDGVRLDEAQERVNEFYAEENEVPDYEGCDAYGDFRDVLARDDIDAVLIATPDHWHAIPAIMAAKAGKDIYCEKPLTLTIDEGKAMVREIRRYGRVFQTGSQLRSESGVKRACELVRNGRIGKLKQVNVNPGGWPMPQPAHVLPAEPTPDRLDWDMWLGQATWRPYSSELAPEWGHDGWAKWRLYQEFGGGNTTDFGTHDFDKAQWAMDMDRSGPVRVVPAGVEDNEYMLFYYDNGVVMQYGGARDGDGEPLGGRAQEFIGTAGRIVVTGGSLRATDPPEIEDEPLRPDDERLYENESHWRDWIECIKTRRDPICDVEIGHRSVTICHLANIAYWLGRPIEWDPQAETFKGNDTAAEKYMSRAMRSPWSLDMAL